MLFSIAHKFVSLSIMYRDVVNKDCQIPNLCLRDGLDGPGVDCRLFTSTIVQSICKFYMAIIKQANCHPHACSKKKKRMIAGFLDLSVKP